MKKTFTLEHTKIKLPRVVDSVKHEVKKYLKRERKKPLPTGANYWGFECKVGDAEAAAIDVHLAELNKNIDKLVENGTKTIYVELTAKAIVKESANEKPSSQWNV